MTTTMTRRPKAEEHDPYYTKYVVRVPDGDIATVLGEQMQETIALLRAVGPDREDFAYAPGKWTIKEVVGHICDTERVMGLRALWFARNDPASLPGFDENSWVPNGNFGARTLADLIEELEAVRAVTVNFAKHLDEATLSRHGTANGQGVSVRALLYIIAGHERHHVALLRERYQV